MMARSALLLGASLALLAAACAKADEPKAPAPAASTATSPITSDAGEEADAAGALKALPMPQKFPHVTWEAGAPDAAKH